MALEEVGYAEVRLEEAVPGSVNLQREATVLEDGEAEVLVPILSGSLPVMTGASAELSRETEDIQAGGFELKVSGLGGSRNAKVTVTSTAKLSLKSGETKTRYIAVPIVWKRLADPAVPGNTWLTFEPGDPPEGRYKVVVDDARLRTVGAIVHELDNLVDGDPLVDSESRESVIGVSFGLDIENEALNATAAVTVELESTTTTSIEYSLPRGRYELTWLPGQAGLYIATR